MSFTKLLTVYLIIFSIKQIQGKELHGKEIIIFMEDHVEKKLEILAFWLRSSLVSILISLKKT